MGRREMWTEALEAAAAVPGFEARPRGREYHLECVDKTCDWKSNREDVKAGARWISPRRRHARELVRYAWTHATRHHVNVPPKPDGSVVPAV